MKQEVATDAAKILDGTSESGKVEVPAGLYYEVSSTDDLDTAMTVVARDLSSGTEISVSKPGSSKGFIKVRLGTKSFGNQVVPNNQ